MRPERDEEAFSVIVQFLVINPNERAINLNDLSASLSN